MARGNEANADLDKFRLLRPLISAKHSGNLISFDFFMLSDVIAPHWHSSSVLTHSLGFNLSVPSSSMRSHISLRCALAKLSPDKQSIAIKQIARNNGILFDLCFKGCNIVKFDFVADPRMKINLQNFAVKVG